jgi:hypothetical protein
MGSIIVGTTLVCSFGAAFAIQKIALGCFLKAIRLGSRITS